MRKAIPVILLSAAGFALVWQYQPSTSSEAVSLPPPAAVAPVQPPASPGTSSSTSAPPEPGGAAATKTVAGSPETNRHGVVQVQVTFTGDQITDVQFLKLPSTGPSQKAGPLLRQETLRTQSADIDTVSGATQTSDSYIASLQAAIDAKG
jgi:uncharacterized protein with FMN-binding domain